MNNHGICKEEKNFIKENKNLIDSEKWDEFFGYAWDLPYSVNRVYQFIMFEAGVDLLHKMSYIPFSALSPCSYPVGDLIIPSTIERIEEEAFQYCRTLTSVDLSQTKIKEIPDMCFDTCDNLKEVVLPKTCKAIKPFAFRNCPLETVYISKKSPNLKYIEKYFEGDFRNSFSNVKLILT